MDTHIEYEAGEVPVKTRRREVSFADWLIRHHLAQDEHQASLLLLGAFIGISLVILFIWVWPSFTGPRATGAGVPHTPAPHAL